MIYSNIKTLDLHGENSDIAKILVVEFIDDCYKMGLEDVIIIHGIGTGTLRKIVQRILTQHKKVDHFYLDFYNIGQTIVKIKKNV